jgi:hypothetical protein
MIHINNPFFVHEFIDSTARRIYCRSVRAVPDHYRDKKMNKLERLQAMTNELAARQKEMARQLEYIARHNCSKSPRAFETVSKLSKRQHCSAKSFGLLKSSSSCVPTQHWFTATLHKQCCQHTSDTNQLNQTNSAMVDECECEFGGVHEL